MPSAPAPGSGPRIVGLTGGIGSGKSSVRALFEDLGVPCLDADLVARAIHQDPHHPAAAAIARALPHAMSATGTLRRGSLRQLLATDPAANRQLKHILKPHVLAAAQQWTRAQRAPYVVWESALMIEEAIPCDRMLVIDTDEATRLARIETRNPDWTSEQIRNMVRIQPPRAVYLAQADDLVRNDGLPDQLATRVRQLHHLYLANWT
jgi:dephospho-CoA kinase